MITIYINDRKVDAAAGEMLLPLLTRSGIKVPTLCNLPELFPSGACRLCVVEVEGRPGLVPSCAFPVSDGMRVRTHSPRVLRARKTIIELLLADHPDDCLYCVRNGNCELQALAESLGVRERRFAGGRRERTLDASGPSLVRDPAKCILCGRCVRVCEEVQGVSAIDFTGRGSDTQIDTAFGDGLNISSCVKCGQCIMVCPTGALREQSGMKQVVDALNDPERVVVVQHAPAVSVTLAEEFGVKPGTDVCGMLTTALRQLGFDRVFDTSFAADLTVMEEASELVQRLTQGGRLPMLTSCSPAWVKFVEQFYPEMTGNLSTCKSPQQMLGAVIKRYYAAKEGIAPEKVYSVAIMPCTAKKFEAERPEMVGEDDIPDIDAVLTTRELARILRMRGIDLPALPPSPADSPLGERSTAGKIFGTTGGVMEAAVRTAHYLLTGRDLEHLEVKPVRGLQGVKEATVAIDGLEVKVAVVSGLGNARRLLDEVKAGLRELHFIEVMSCPGGCIAGGGQPLSTDKAAVKARMQALYRLDRQESVRTAHANQSIARLYADFLGRPLGEKSHELLHTHYRPRTGAGPVPTVATGAEAD